MDKACRLCCFKTEDTQTCSKRVSIVVGEIRLHGDENGVKSVVLTSTINIIQHDTRPGVHTSEIILVMTKKATGRSNSVSPDAATINDMNDCKKRSCWEADDLRKIEYNDPHETDTKRSNESEGEGSHSRLVKEPDKNLSELKLRSVELGVSDLEKPNVLHTEKQSKCDSNSSEQCEYDCCVRQSKKHSFSDIINKIFKSKRFESDKLERLYQRYFFRLNQKFINWIIFLIFLLLTVLVGLHFGKEDKEHTKPYWLKGLFLPLIFILYVAILIVINRSNSTQKHLRLSSYAMVFLSCCFVTVDFLLRPVSSAADGVWLSVFFIYLTYTLLPVRMRLAVFGGCAIATVHLVCCARRDLVHDDHLHRLVSFTIY